MSALEHPKSVCFLEEKWGIFKKFVFYRLDIRDATYLPPTDASTAESNGYEKYCHIPPFWNYNRQ
jgi:hypothetical protein